MAQQTNLSVSPYFDDFDERSNYQKVLFKPGYPVQARELTSLQSSLQSQIDRFGRHLFKDGAKVIPGNTSYVQFYPCIEINSTHNGVPLDLYIDQLVGRRIIGLTSGVTAIVEQYLTPDQSERGNYTLYITYASSSVSDKVSNKFLDGEFIALGRDVITTDLNPNYIPAGQAFGSLISLNSNSSGSSFQINDGVYFIRGFFVNVPAERLVLSQYNNEPSGRIGFRVFEEIINSDEDESLTDNSKGFNNYAAPGADRLKVSVALAFKPFSDINDADFVELASVRDGTLIEKVKYTEYDVLSDEFARRTYEESGNYFVKAFDIDLLDTLNNSLNGGLYSPGQLTTNGNVPTDDLATYEVSPGKAYIHGRETELIGHHFVDIAKPRTTKTLNNQSIEYNTGSTIKLNKVTGLAEIGIGNTYILSLRDQRVGTDPGENSVPSGDEIGVARVYDFALESGSYSFENGDINQWDLTLYDVQMTTKVTLNEPADISIPTFVKGKYTGATGFAQTAVTDSTALRLYETKGEFAPNEPLLFNGVESSRVAVAVTASKLQDAKSIYAGPSLGDVGFAKTFSGDIILSKRGFNIGLATITSSSLHWGDFGAETDDNIRKAVYYPTAGITTMVGDDSLSMVKNVRVNDIIKYTTSGTNSPSDVEGGRTWYNRVTKVVKDLADGTAMTGSFTGTDFEKYGPHIQLTAIPDIPGAIEYGNTIGRTGRILGGQGYVWNVSAQVMISPLNENNDRSLFTPMPKQNISDVSLLNAQLTIRKKYTVDIADNKLSTPVLSEDNETFLPFDEEDYILVRSDGRTEELSEDRFEIASGGQSLQIRNLGGDDTSATLVATLRKTNPKAKVKLRNRANSIVVDKSRLASSGVGATTLNDGLTYGNYPYGTRVQDETISLNSPDIITILGIFETTNLSNGPSAPKLTLTALNTPSTKTTDLNIGERIFGERSEAIAVYVERIDDDKISCVYLTESEFEEGEVLTFQETEYQALLSRQEITSKNISDHYVFNTGQKVSYYNYGSIKRKDGFDAPSKSIKIYFANGYYDGSDTGDITIKNSYNSFDYTTEVRDINGIRNTDMIDIRPRVNDYAVQENVRSPLEFYGRLFDASGNSAANILASDKSILTSFSFYLGRIDRLYLSKLGTLQVQRGNPSEAPQKPLPVDDALELATIVLPPYLYNVNDAAISFLEHKRYQMKDIHNLERRIESLEYYTSLSLLEQNTESLFVPDADGLDQFKSGFFVDNFGTNLNQEQNFTIKNSIDINLNELRPRHYTNSIDLEPGPVENVDPDADMRYQNAEGVNIRKSEDNTVTLNYDEILFLSQPFRTRSESVTPYLVAFWIGTLKLDPSSDTWVDTVRLDAKVTVVEGNYTDTLQLTGADPQTGLGPIIWGAPETTWTGSEVNFTMITRNETRVSNIDNNLNTNVDVNVSGRNVSATVSNTLNTQLTQTTTTFMDRTAEVFRTGVETRTGTRALVTEVFNDESQGDKIIKRDVITIMRSRNITFVGTQLKPQTRVYPFFDGKGIDKYCTPKLLQIRMTSGTFQVGERIVGRVPGKNNNNIHPLLVSRLAVPNHREGPFNNPSKIIISNPYTTVLATAIEDYYEIEGTAAVATQANLLPTEYTSTSDFLNLDLLSMSNINNDFRGYAASGMVIRGISSGATAVVTEKQFIVDYSSRIYGSFFIPNPNFSANLKFNTGKKQFVLADNPDNAQAPVDTSAATQFESTGSLETVQEEIISTRNARIEWIEMTDTQEVREFVGSQVDTFTLGSTTNIINDTATSIGSDAATLPPVPAPRPIVQNITNVTNIQSTIQQAWRNTGIGRNGDPLAQTFSVFEPTGVFATGCDIFFETVDQMNIPVIFQLRPVVNGYPSSSVILPHSEVSIDPEDITVSEDGSVPHRVVFPAPVYLAPEKDYAIILWSLSTKYRVFISRVEENDLVTDEYVSQQPSLGSLFKSQNAKTWEPSQWEDLTFNLYAARFQASGSIDFYNPPLNESNSQIPTLMKDSISVKSNRVVVGLGSTLVERDLGTGRLPMQLGNTIFQESAGESIIATGDLVGKAGIATGNLAVINAGIGYTPLDGVYYFSDVELTNVTGFGRNLLAEVEVSSGKIGVVTVTSTSGSGYQVGDVLGINTIGNASVGRNARLSVVSIASTDTLILDNVQGQFTTGVGKTMRYTDGTGITSSINENVEGDPGTVTLSRVDVVDDGLHIKVNHKNHGMHHEINTIQLSGVKSDINPTRLSSAYGIEDTSSIVVDDSSEFGTFENVSVGSTHPGYIRINDEIIEYTGVSGNTLTGITRGENIVPYEANELVEKYEFSGVSLRRINKSHNLSDVTISNPISLDSYHVKIDMSQDGDDRSVGNSTPSHLALKLSGTKTAGGQGITASQNMPFEIINPQVQNITVPGTLITGEVRTVTGTNIGNGSGQGTDIPFVDQGFEPVELNTLNYMDSTRVIASRVNELNSSSLSQLPGRRSFGLRVNMRTSNPFVSPVVDLERVNVVLTSNRIDAPVSDFITDNRVNSITEDPHSCSYITRESKLEQPATSIKVIFNAHINIHNDIRVFYAISDSDNFEPIFIPFPGYNNLDDFGNTIEIDKNDGRPDKFVPLSSPNSVLARDLSYREYTFTASNLPIFKSYRIKFVMTSTDQAHPPRVRDFRAICFA